MVNNKKNLTVRITACMTIKDVGLVASIIIERLALTNVPQRVLIVHLKTFSYEILFQEQ